MIDTERIIKLSRYIILLAVSCFIVYLFFILESYSSAVNRLERQFEESTFPQLTDLIERRIDLFFRPSIKALTLLSDTLDWQLVLQEAESDPSWLKSHMKTWAAALEINSVGISDKDRKIVWDYWSDKPIVLDPALDRDAWFFDFWKNEKKPEWTFTLYSEDNAKDYRLYIDRLLRDRNGRPIGSIAAQLSLSMLRKQLEEIITLGERIIIIDDLGNALIDISRMEIGDGVRVFGHGESAVKEKNDDPDDMLINKVLSEDDDYGHLTKEDENIFYKRMPVFNGEMSILAVMDTGHLLKRERDRLIKDLIVLFVTFTLFVGGMLVTLMLFTRRLQFLAIKLEQDKSKFEDLLFIITHGLSNEIQLLQKTIDNIPRRYLTGIDLRLSEMSLMIQNSVNAARLDGGKSLIIPKSFNFVWQWEKLGSNFKLLSVGKGQTFLSSRLDDCMVNNDEEMVYQILANLVSNAIKYAPRGGIVKLDARIEGESLLVTINDSGPGFLPEERADLFSKFKRLSAKPSGGERSTGIGLYIAKQLADACGIRFELSESGGELSGAMWELEFKID